MTLLDRTVGLLTPHMGEAERNTWLTLAFHPSCPVVYDAIPRAGSARDFTVECVRRLLDHAAWMAATPWRGCWK